MNPKNIRRAMLVALWTVVGSSFTLSFAGVRALGIQSGYTEILASLLPLCIDGLVLAGSISVLDAELRGRSKRYGWTITLIGVAASVAANVTVAHELGLTAQIVHSGPPIILALALEAWLSSLRGDVQKEAVREAQEAAGKSAPIELDKPKKAVATPAEVHALIDAGATQAQAAAALNTSRATIQKLLKTPAGEDPAWAKEEVTK